MEKHKHTGVYGLAIQNGKMLLIKKARGPYTGQWDLPGGSLEFGETPTEGLRREMREETGLKVLKSDLLDVLSKTVVYRLGTGEQQEVHHLGIIYAVAIDSPEENLKVGADGEDSEGARWIKLNEIDPKELSPFARQGLAMAKRSLRDEI